MVPIKQENLLDAFDWVSCQLMYINSAYVSKVDGRIYYLSELDQFEEDIPEDIEDSDQYISIPHKNELELGSNLVYRFTEEFLPDDYDKVRSIFRRRSAYGRFKDLLQDRGFLEKWYTNSEEALNNGIVSWAKEEGLELSA